eukprot:30145-Pelagococcus_subviridis.AAC.4
MFAAGSAKHASPPVDVIFPRLEKKNQPSAEAPSARITRKRALALRARALRVFDRARGRFRRGFHRASGAAIGGPGEPAAARAQLVEKHPVGVLLRRQLRNALPSTVSLPLALFRLRVRPRDLYLHRTTRRPSPRAAHGPRRDVVPPLLRDPARSLSPRAANLLRARQQTPQPFRVVPSERPGRGDVRVH